MTGPGTPVLSPKETEHVDYLDEFGSKGDRFGCKTVPSSLGDAYSAPSRPPHLVCSGGEELLIRVLQEDHKCWCPPDTLKNLTTRHTDRSVRDTVGLFNGISPTSFAEEET